MALAAVRPPYTVGVSLKMYFGHAQTVTWATDVASIARTHQAVQSGLVELFVMPTFPSLVPVREALIGSGVILGAQDLATADSGAFTGEVSGSELRELGCDLVEIGHAERRRLFHEDDTVVAAKVDAAFRNDLTPLICVGEGVEQDATSAIAAVTQQLAASLDGPEARAESHTHAAPRRGPVVVAYEPVWAIGAAEPAPRPHIVAVLDGIEAWLDKRPELAGSRVLYGGSAGPGLLTAGEGRIRGLFLGRFAHDPSALAGVLDEVHD
ncbi:triose-phosphate isomerase family protein [Curtobacterium ammoniigenes]|uniref:triose-phosphate isomerase family protein n=1 Tax=Curtobacterium ammoniigenes TaxID=395387 RepID=UPI0008343C77|nr:triose-phosphate isomerase family protein [Curtobacterium ammoniigenes]